LKIITELEPLVILLNGGQKLVIVSLRGGEQVLLGETGARMISLRRVVVFDVSWFEA